jgi:cadmium resistance protein CadD (predicted permease)
VDSTAASALSAIGLAAFAVTDIDDLFVLVAFFAGGAYRASQIVLGQYLGIAALIAVSATSYFLRLVLPMEWVGLVGIVPLTLGVKEIVELRRDKRRGGEGDAGEGAPVAGGGPPGVGRALSVAAVTIANGGDNVGVYVPLFAASSPLQIALLTAVFLAMTGLWLLLAWALVSNRLFGRQIRAVGRRLLPLVLVGLGVFILWKQGTWLLVARLFGAPA